MNLDLFKKHIEHPELLNDRTIEELKAIVEEFPFFQTARLLLLKNLHNQGDIRYERELKKTALWTTDRKKLFYLLDNRVLLSVDEKYENAKTKTETKHAEKSHPNKKEEYFAPKDIKTKPKLDELDELILAGSAGTGTFYNVDDNVDLESFKHTFGKSKENTTATKQEETSGNRRNALIDSFIVNQPKISNPDEFKNQARPKLTEVQDSSGEMITDTLAKIYIKQGFNEKAIHAYEKLSLKYPEKNAYFVDQIKKIKGNINN